MDSDAKDAISHRGKALKKFVAQLQTQKSL
jgi:inosine/xanthosine triphosphate pyrophosphatase family protein